MSFDFLHAIAVFLLLTFLLPEFLHSQAKRVSEHLMRRVVLSVGGLLKVSSASDLSPSAADW